MPRLPRPLHALLWFFALAAVALVAGCGTASDTLTLRIAPVAGRTDATAALQVRCPEDRDVCRAIGRALARPPQSCTRMGVPWKLSVQGTWEGQPLNQQWDVINCRGPYLAVVDALAFRDPAFVAFRP